jgi:hypothetical protein
MKSFCSGPNKCKDVNKLKNIDIIHNTITPDLVEKHFPKGQCKERGQAIVLHAEMLIAIDKMIKGQNDTDKRAV